VSIAPLRRRLLRVPRRFREARIFVKAVRSPRHPILAHIIPVRRCNLSCAYCNEFDSYSKPVPIAEMLRRVDLLVALGTTVITISGGEPLLHPDLHEIIRRIRRHGSIATLITNGYLLTPDRIRRLNHAGLDTLQISIDNVLPDATSKKSLKVLDKKLQSLAQYAEFEVTINCVVGSGVRNAEDALIIAKRARELGFASTVGIIHDHSGHLLPLTDEQQAVLNKVLSLPQRTFSFARYDHFQRNLARGLPNNWRCHAGSRYLYICEDGFVHWCSQQRGYPAIPLEQYTAEHLEREYHSVKSCAPYCTISCVHQTALLDELRERPLETIHRLFTPVLGDGSSVVLPLPVRLLTWLFLKNSQRQTFARMALRLFGMD
jgi:MoaA/NifB/PqqE/SkfB family radical SAM enzyme